LRFRAKRLIYRIACVLCGIVTRRAALAADVIVSVNVRDDDFVGQKKTGAPSSDVAP
jgi:hypothetical protein